MQLFYNSEITNKTETFTFDKTESGHIIKVLRKNVGDVLHITNGKGMLFTVKIVVPNDKKCLVKIIEVVAKPNPRTYYLHIAIAPTKNNDRLEWFLEKATEIGIDEITPIICENSERKIVKIDRMQKIVQAAMKQSLKFELPKINEPLLFSDCIKQDFEGVVFIAHCEEQDKKSLAKTSKPNQKITVFIGPEGDFSPKEIKQALNKKFIPVSLGDSRLRTETAGVVVAQTVALINELR